jgi:hypothetical protein
VQVWKSAESSDSPVREAESNRAGYHLPKMRTVVAAGTVLVALVVLLAFAPLPAATGEGFRGVILGAVIAGAVAIGGEWLRGRNEAELDQSKRRDELRVERARFQRQNLLELQESLTAWGRAIGRAHMADLEAVRSTGRLGMLPTDLDAEIMDAERELDYRVQRSINAVLRSVLEDLLGLHAVVLSRRAGSPATTNEVEIRLDIADFKSAYSSAQYVLGETLREYL